MKPGWFWLLGIAGALNLSAAETRLKDVARVGGVRTLVCGDCRSMFVLEEAGLPRREVGARSDPLEVFQRRQSLVEDSFIVNIAGGGFESRVPSGRP